MQKHMYSLKRRLKRWCFCCMSKVSPLLSTSPHSISWPSDVTSKVDSPTISVLATAANGRSSVDAHATALPLCKTTGSVKVFRSRMGMLAMSLLNWGVTNALATIKLGCQDRSSIKSTQPHWATDASTFAITSITLCGGKITRSCTTTLASFNSRPLWLLVFRSLFRGRALPLRCSTFCSVLLQHWLFSKKSRPSMASEFSALATIKSPCTSMPAKLILKFWGTPKTGIALP